MARPDGRLEPGQPLRGAISARAWNRAQDAADIVLGSQSGFSVPPASYSLPYHWIYVRMAVDVEYGDCVSLQGFWDGTTQAGKKVSDEVLMRPIPVLFGSAIKQGQGDQSHERHSAFGIAVEPIKAGDIGRVAISGVVACNVYCKKMWHAYARPSAFGEGTSKLVSSNFGNIQILFWHVSSTDVNWYNEKLGQGQVTPPADVNEEISALVRIGNTTPFQLVTIIMPGSWPKDTAKMVGCRGPSYSDNNVAPGGIQPPQDAFSVNGGSIDVFNPFCDINSTGVGVCARFGDRWILVSWTPTEVEPSTDYLNENLRYFVSSTREV